MKKSAERILADSDYLYGQDGNSRSYYEDLANFCLPRKAWINSIRVLGERMKDQFLYDVRAIISAQESVCGFHTNLTNPSSRYFETAYSDDRTMQAGGVQRYLKECDDIQYDVMNDSNFEDGILENYMDHLIFGPGYLMTEDDEVDHVRYTEIPVEQYSFVCDARGRVMEVYRRFTYTALQCVSMKDWKCPKEVHDAIKDGKAYKTFDIVHFIGPRDERDPYKEDKLSMAWQSRYIMKKPEQELYEGGYHELPAAIGRWWKDSNDPRGFSPAMNALASVKLLNAEKRTLIRHGMKKSDPASMMPYRSFLNTPNFNPSAMNYYDAKKFKPDAFKWLTPEGDSGLNVEMMDMEAQIIDRCFFVDIFRAMSSLTMDKKKRSIPEIQRIIAEGMSMLGPVVGKVINETLDPVLSRTHNILKRRGLFPPEPEALKNKKRKINYMSPLARAQKQSQLQGITSWLQLHVELSQFNQAVLDPIDFDRVSKKVAEIQGVDPTFYKSPAAVKQLREQRAKMQQQQAKIAMAEQAAGAAHKGAQAHKAVAEAQAVE